MSERLIEFRNFRISEGSGKAVLVRLRNAKGSTPREQGAFMVVSPTNFFGTIGGGRLEHEAIEAARSILKGAGASRLELPLGPETGQCCGGHAELDFELLTSADLSAIERMLEAEAVSYPEVWLFGGGHVGRALARALSLLPVRIHVVESRADELERAQGKVHEHLSAVPESLVAEARPGSAVVVATHDHGMDFLIVSAALQRDDLAYVGMVGSQTKRAVFTRRFLEEQGAPARLERLSCPIGLKIPDKRPEVIAAMAAAEVMAALTGYPPG